jgi:anti-sigma factor RsiW
MKECWLDGDLRAYLDRELPPQRMTEMAVHLGGCAECHARYNEIAGRASRVAAWMETLEFEPATMPLAPPGRLKPSRVAGVLAAVLAMAAAVAAAFVLLPRGSVSPKPVAAPHVTPSRPVMRQAAASQAAGPQNSSIRAPSIRASAPKRSKPAPVQEYLALDDEPIDTGVVMRVAFEGTGMQADVIFDADGRARAIRTVK